MQLMWSLISIRLPGVISVLVLPAALVSITVSMPINPKTRIGNVTCSIV